MLIFTVILAAMLFVASAGLMSVAEPACERPRARREPVLARREPLLKPTRVAVHPSLAGSGWRLRSGSPTASRSMSLAQLYRTS
jgi:hypothetical protein